MKKKAIGYIRASISEAKQRNSFAVQRRAIEAFANAHNYSIDEMVCEYESGGKDERAGFRKCLSLADKEDYTIIVMKVDRLSRSLSAWGLLEASLGNLRVVQLGDQPVSSLHLSILLCLGQNERTLISQRVKDTYNLLKEKHGDKLKWGNPNIASESAKAVVVRKANANRFNQRIHSLVNPYLASGNSRQDAVNFLNECGLKTRRGQVWNYASLGRVLRYTA